MRKGNIKKAVQAFVKNTGEIMAFTQRCTEERLIDQDLSSCYDLAIIRLYYRFENLMLECLGAAINSDATTFSQLKGRNFPNHMSVEVCEYLVYGDGYFNFSGRGGLIGKVNKFVPRTNWLPNKAKRQNYQDALEKICALRNFAVHDSSVSKRRVLKAISQKVMSLSGAWLKSKGCFASICERLRQLA